MKYLFIIFFLASNIYAQTYGGGFVYEFHDASVPPEYHRSYMISIEDTNVMFRVDSYGDLLLEERFSITRLDLEQFKKQVRKCNIRYAKKGKENKGCTGGTSDSFFLYWSDEDKQDGYTETCGGTQFGNITGKIEELRNLFKNMVPNLSMKIAGTLN